MSYVTCIFFGGGEGGREKIDASSEWRVCHPLGTSCHVLIQTTIVVYCNSFDSVENLKHTTYLRFSKISHFYIFEICTFIIHTFAFTPDEFDKDTNITEDDFDLIIGKFKKKNKKSFHFQTKSGTLSQRAIYKLCKRMMMEECFPKDFAKTVLYHLWKRKGSRQDLNNHRYIHLKEWLPRLTDALTVNLMTEDIIKSGK